MILKTILIEALLVCTKKKKKMYWYICLRELHIVLHIFEG